MRTAEPFRAERRHGIPVDYLRVPTLPLVTNWIDPWLWARAAEGFVGRLLQTGGCATILDGHFLYPDGVAAVLLGRRFGVPVVLTARGSDVNVKCENPVIRRWIKWAAANCSALITVSRALAEKASAYGVRAAVTEVLPNGVDLVRFSRLDRSACRARLGVEGEVIASVGHLVPAKGHAIAIEGLSFFPNMTLLIVGEGPEQTSLQALARSLGVASRVRFIGHVPHEDMPQIYSAADALVLASRREGMPNVVLESLACGTPVVATDVGGTGEVVTAPAAGQLMRERSVGALCEALRRLLEGHPTATQTRKFAERFGWSATVDRQTALYASVLGASAEKMSSESTAT